ncbi:alkaline phosphatase D family protein [Nocardioides bruguierae]|uniref:alkaline phosphatase D family protein n=1 Tax=Nocardioides bruguierae TaxID=2945102 RepID=UPI0020220D63|nr:alkaline phosphatase D family protein [Nocardioides bruguierae]MCL8025029.1 alkaline phosphatase D family protein [Nocardioides bruguierae]
MTTSADDQSQPARPSRRTVLSGAAATGLTASALTASTGTGPAAAAGSTHQTQDADEAAARRAGHRVFRHGVASGDPLPDAVVLWTRVTPTRDASPGSGIGPRTTVGWQVAADRAFTRVVRRGRFTTGRGRDHTVKIDVAGLAPATTYYYRFTALGQTSRTGRTRTAPSHDAALASLRVGMVSCGNWQAGYFAAYRGLADRDDLDLVLHLGDYLYEYGPGEYGYGPDDVDIRSHEPAHEMVGLADYRRRHGQYKTDRDLQRAHARHPWVVTWDDHETTNDAYDDGAENHQPDTEGDWPTRRARAHRAYDEWMPVRMAGTADLRDGSRLFRRLRFGTLAQLNMLDLRTYRSQQPGLTDGAAIDDPERTITGAQQMAWLKDSLTNDPGTPQWKVVGNPVMIAPVTFAGLPSRVTRAVDDVTGLLPDDGQPYNVDQWDGYTADRREVFAHLQDEGVTDVLFLTGDIHSGWACELPVEAGDYAVTRESVGVELVCASVTSGNLKDITGAPEATPAVEAAILANNPHVKHLDFDNHGFCVLELTPERAQCDWFVIGDRAEVDTPITWSVSWTTQASSNRVTRAAAPLAGTPEEVR